jgi:hypothetical protein
MPQAVSRLVSGCSWTGCEQAIKKVSNEPKMGGRFGCWKQFASQQHELLGAFQTKTASLHPPPGWTEFRGRTPYRLMLLQAQNLQRGLLDDLSLPEAVSGPRAHGLPKKAMAVCKFKPRRGHIDWEGPTTLLSLWHRAGLWRMMDDS